MVDPLVENVRATIAALAAVKRARTIVGEGHNIPGNVALSRTLQATVETLEERLRALRRLQHLAREVAP